MESDGNGQPREDETGCVIERIAERAFIDERAVDEDGECRDGAFADHDDDDRCYCEGQGEIHQRDEQVLDPSGKAGHAASPVLETPAIMRPI